MSKQDSHTGALYCKISGELHLMPYTGKDVADLRNTLAFHDSLMVKQQAKIEEQGAQIQKLLAEKIELCEKVEELKDRITEVMRGVQNDSNTDHGYSNSGRLQKRKQANL
jgi:predicted RNase H-like nuclease (RuvC/YqgF family)